VETGFEHGRELSGEEHQRVELDASPEALQRALKHQAQRRRAGSVHCGPHRDDELPALAQELHQLGLVLRLLPATRDGASAIHDLVFEDWHRYS
jgi:hypothetical protein